MRVFTPNPLQSETLDGFITEAIKLCCLSEGSWVVVRNLGTRKNVDRYKVVCVQRLRTKKVLHFQSTQHRFAISSEEVHRFLATKSWSSGSFEIQGTKEVPSNVQQFVDSHRDGYFQTVVVNQRKGVVLIEQHNGLWVYCRHHRYCCHLINKSLNLNWSLLSKFGWSLRVGYGPGVLPENLITKSKEHLCQCVKESMLPLVQSVM